MTLIGCLVLGSNAASVTCWACWVAVTRGLNERSVCGHSSWTGLSALGLRKYALVSWTTNSNPTRSASRQMKSQSVSLSCCMKSWGSPVLSH